MPGGFYHVTLRGNHRQPIFHCNADRALLDEIVADTVARFGARVHAFCWMTNHVHLLVQVAEAPLGRVMHGIASRYARSMQAQASTTGHLFERRYHALLVDADAYLLQLICYIHLNPVRAGLVGHPDEYPWSSHRDYLGPQARPWITTEFTLAMFSDNKPAARAAYRRFTQDADGWAEKPPFPDDTERDPRVMGDDRFLDQLPIPSSQIGPSETLDEIIARVCARENLGPQDLASPNGTRRLTQARAEVAAHAYGSGAATLSDISKRFNRSVSAMSKAVGKYSRR